MLSDPHAELQSSRPPWKYHECMRGIFWGGPVHRRTVSMHGDDAPARRPAQLTTIDSPAPLTALLLPTTLALASTFNTLGLVPTTRMRS